MDIKIGIIGSAGRRGTMDRVTLDIFYAMVNDAISDIKKLLLQDNNISIYLVSGGGALSDHVAVDIWLSYREIMRIKGLTLYMPCGWNYVLNRFVDNGKKDYKSNPGGTSNYYHDLFQKRTGICSLQEIGKAIKEGAHADYRNFGFFNRNDKVADVDYMIAFGFGDKEPDTSGTMDTWKKSSAKKIYHKIPV